MTIRFSDQAGNSPVKKSATDQSGKKAIAVKALAGVDGVSSSDVHGVREKGVRKEQIALRLDEDLLEWFRSTGPGWQVRMRNVLRDYVEKARQPPR